jgi:hypothetical protein
MSNQDRFAVTSAVITCEAEPEILRRAAGTHPPLAGLARHGGRNSPLPGKVEIEAGPHTLLESAIWDEVDPVGFQKSAWACDLR